ncbi:Leucine Rich repeat [Carpediemonas membranifera]|uniref:Leucine Rich repeat n=1 Tax=Carpediemonas membranifera TaxID=201153 RepID=A0A8J6ATK9_9EUKA|nr:Leucine Rich repeat [Carpediemonas membranifera]|eukprot:KAG9393778.1 Leucine Rich repeat [Carpediemonas membranifera]
MRKLTDVFIQECNAANCALEHSIISVLDHIERSDEEQSLRAVFLPSQNGDELLSIMYKSIWRAPAALPSLINLRSIEYDGNRLSAEGVLSLMNLVRIAFTRLRELHLSNNLLGDEGATLLCESLAMSDVPLERLYIGDNRLTTGSAQAIADYIASTKSLEVLSLRTTGSPAGHPRVLHEGPCGKLAQALTATVDERRSVVVHGMNQSFSFSADHGNALDADAGLILAAAVRENESLLEVDVLGNPISGPGLSELLKACAEQGRIRALGVSLFHRDHGLLVDANSWNDLLRLIHDPEIVRMDLGFVSMGPITVSSPYLPGRCPPGPQMIKFADAIADGGRYIDEMTGDEYIELTPKQPRGAATVFSPPPVLQGPAPPSNGGTSPQAIAHTPSMPSPHNMEPQTVPETRPSPSPAPSTRAFGPPPERVTAEPAHTPLRLPPTHNRSARPGGFPVSSFSVLSPQFDMKATPLSMDDDPESETEVEISGAIWSMIQSPSSRGLGESVVEPHDSPPLQVLASPMQPEAGRDRDLGTISDGPAPVEEATPVATPLDIDAESCEEHEEEELDSPRSLVAASREEEELDSPRSLVAASREEEELDSPRSLVAASREEREEEELDSPRSLVAASHEEEELDSPRSLVAASREEEELDSPRSLVAASREEREEELDSPRSLVAASREEEELDSPRSLVAASREEEELDSPRSLVAASREEEELDSPRSLVAASREEEELDSPRSLVAASREEEELDSPRSLVAASREEEELDSPRSLVAASHEEEELDSPRSLVAASREEEELDSPRSLVAASHEEEELDSPRSLVAASREEEELDSPRSLVAASHEEEELDSPRSLVAASREEREEEELDSPRSLVAASREEEELDSPRSLVAASHEGGGARLATLIGRGVARGGGARLATLIGRGVARGGGARLATLIGRGVARGARGGGARLATLIGRGVARGARGGGGRGYSLLSRPPTTENGPLQATRFRTSAVLLFY